MAERSDRVIAVYDRLHIFGEKKSFFQRDHVIYFVFMDERHISIKFEKL